MRGISGRRALVTGAASGIGRATVLRFVSEGMRVVAVDLPGEGLDTLEAETDGSVLAVPADVTVESEIEAAYRTADDRWSGVDVVVANAGIQLFGEDTRADELALDVWQRTIDVNLTGVFLTCKHGLKSLLANGGGSVICTASPTSTTGKAKGFDAYTASKAGVLGLVRVMANDYAADNIRVNAVIPGFTATPLVKDLIDDKEGLAEMLQAIPLGRPGTPGEVASVMLFLASDESSYTTGAAFTADGGITAV